MGTAAAARGVDVLFALTAPQPVSKKTRRPSPLAAPLLWPSQPPLLWPRAQPQLLTVQPIGRLLNELLQPTGRGPQRGGPQESRGRVLRGPRPGRRARTGAAGGPVGCNPMCWRLQPYVLEVATLCAGGCNPTCGRLQPYAPTLCSSLCRRCWAASRASHRCRRASQSNPSSRRRHICIDIFSSRRKACLHQYILFAAQACLHRLCHIHAQAHAHAHDMCMHMCMCMHASY